jgi:ribosomal protein L35
VIKQTHAGRNHKMQKKRQKCEKEMGKKIPAISESIYVLSDSHKE